jgi:hypothetical protein
VPIIESEEDWHEHRAGTLASLQPEGHLERTLADRVALTLWRLFRVARYEAEQIAVSQETLEEDDGLSIPFSRSAPKLSPLRETLAGSKQGRQAFRKLARAGDGDEISPEVAMAVIAAAEDLPVLERLVEDGFEYPGMPDGPYEVEGWTAGLLRRCLGYLAEAAGLDPSLMEKALGLCLDSKVSEAQEELDRAEGFYDRRRRERLLPNEFVLQKVARYEAHLNRQLLSALHELEALQSRRRGEPSPLARLDVSGLDQ